MTTKLEAIYEHGVLKPIQPVSLAEGTRVEVILITPDVEPGANPVADMLAEIASLPLEGGTEPFSGAEHDKILYPKSGRMP